ncbi:MAG: excinuclease ABC subunit UvrA [Alphaproteobacteria bacterium]|nr:excinuclease ABC subunit UvrA [Alphaproteobacteria bacterium]
MQEYIKVVGAREHNLKNINIDIPRDRLVVVTGPSGSGKSSLAFDTIYAEGQRRYVESLSSYARQFLQLNDKPDVDYIIGLSPAIAIDQKTTSKNPRSTVGTITEIYDYLRLLFARIGVPYSPATNLPIISQTISEIVDSIKAIGDGAKIYILAPIARGAKGEFKKEFAQLKKQGYERVLIEQELYEIDDLPQIDKNKKHNIEALVDRIELNDEVGNRLADSVENAMEIGDKIIYVQIHEASTSGTSNYAAGDRVVFSQKYSCPVSGFQIAEIEPRIFSFNSPFGACPACEGLGKEPYFDPNLIILNPRLSLLDGAVDPWKNQVSKVFSETLKSVLKYYKCDPTTPFGDLPEHVKQVILFGTDHEIEFVFGEGSSKEIIKQPFAGVIPSMDAKVKSSEGSWLSEEWVKYKSSRKCSKCDGHRLKFESLCVKIANKHIGHISNLSIADARKWFESLPSELTPKQAKIAERVIKEIKDRIDFLLGVGLDYLTLSRDSGSLSGGESQRIRLASQIGSGLTGVLYVLDEPSIGLHQRDNDRLITTLKNLRDLKNSVIVVEHDEETIMAADYVVDIGPGAGVHGGHVVAQGTPSEITNDINSLTGLYLSGKKFIPVPSKIRTGHAGKFIELIGARANNLKSVDIKIPLGTFTSITGVSGGGKSSLINHTLFRAAQKKLDPSAKDTPGQYDKIYGVEFIDKIIDIDQSPIGRTPRSNPATYTGAFTPIRDWFAGLPESKARGYKVGRFSFNVKGGRCEACEGDGLVKIEMHFLPDVYVNCDICEGKRYNRETLEVKYKGKSISDVLNMTVEDALEFFIKMPVIRDKMQSLRDVGLGYIKIGQSATTLSGGEAQRIKLAKELSRKATGNTLYILDEPTTGLHMDDVSKLLGVLHRLVDLGNSVVVIEHNMDVIKTSDYIIDVGPEGGDNGGKIVASGTPSEIAKCNESHTGRYLKKYLR